MKNHCWIGIIVLFIGVLYGTMAESQVNYEFTPINILDSLVSVDIETLISKVSADSITASLYRLQGFGNRIALADSSYAASEWIYGKLSDYGYTAEYDSFYMQYWYSTLVSRYLIRSGYERNVIGSRIGLNNQSNIISCAHFDAPPVYSGTYFDSLYLAPTPGAYDNGSGTASMMEIARVLKDLATRKNLLFIGFTAEECGGPLGSKHYAAKADSEGMQISCLVDADVIGAYPAYACSLLYTKETGLCEFFKKTAAYYLPEIKVKQGIGVSSNAINFYYDQGYKNCINVYDTVMSSFRHTPNDSVHYLNPEAIAKYTQLQAAGLALMALCPDPVEYSVWQIGNGSECLITWPAAADTIIARYMICYGRTSGSYSDTINVTDLAKQCDTLDGLMADSVYYVTVWAYDSNGMPSVYSEIKTFIPSAMPTKVQDFRVEPVRNGIRLIWCKNPELDVGYHLYRAVNDSINLDSLNVVLLTDTTYTDSLLSGANKYYYAIKAVDCDGNSSPFSDTVYGRPITLDQGILIVDESYWSSSSYPSDAQQDSFYNFIMSGYKVTEYEYDSIQHKPILADLIPYSAVMWHGDDNNSLWASFAVSDIRDYLEAGGKLWFAGWKPTVNIRNNATYPADFFAGNMLYDQFKLSRSELSGVTDSFKMALGLKGYPDIMVDTLKYPLTLAAYGKTMRYIEALTPTGAGDTIYVMDMKNDGSLFEGRACAVRDSGKTVFFGFPLYFMDKEQAKLAAQQVMLEFGEPFTRVEGKPDNRELIRETRLFQNAPNPFKSQTTINYQLQRAGQVKLNIYNIAGQLVKTLVNSAQAVGNYSVKWDGRDDSGL